MSKEKKGKLWTSILIMVVGGSSGLFVAGTIQGILTKTDSVPRLYSPFESLAFVREDPRLYFCILGLLLMVSLTLLLLDNGGNRSGQQITDTLSTPKPAGNKQHGSARWLEKGEWDDKFSNYLIDPKDNLLSELALHGEDDDYVPLSTEKILEKGGVTLGTIIDEKKKNEKIYIADDDVHTLCIGATRSGKSRTVVLQTICTLGLAGESMMISDPKGELFQYTSPFLKKLGYNVKVLDFKSPLKSDRYNFLQPVIDAIDKGDTARAIEAAWDLTSILVGEAKGERIWTDGETSIIASAIMCVVVDNKEGENRKYQNMTNVYHFIAEMCKSVNDTMPLIKYIEDLPSSHPARGLLAISEIAPEKTRGSFYTGAMTTLQLFTNPLIYSMTSESDYQTEQLGKEKMVIYIILPDEKTTYYKIASLLISQHYEQLVHLADARGGRLLNRVNFVLDEFGNFTRIIDFTNKLTVGGGRGMRFYLFVQSFAQLIEKYNKETAVTIKGNCHVWIYLKTEDNDTLREISEKLGYYTVETSGSSSSAGSRSSSSSRSTSLIRRALLLPDEIRMIERPYALVMTGTYPAMMQAPDLGDMLFNKILGLGDMEHNRQVRERRESRRESRNADTDIPLWGIWGKYVQLIKWDMEEKIRRKAEKQKFVARDFPDM
jgi:type IV secretion system protein VirD4